MALSLLACVCGSVYHWARASPNFYENMQNQNKSEDGNIILYSDTVKGFVGETLNTAVLDSGCSKNVCGNTWMKCYLGTSSKEDVITMKTIKIYLLLKMML